MTFEYTNTQIANWWIRYNLHQGQFSLPNCETLHAAVQEQFGLDLPIEVIDMAVDDIGNHIARQILSLTDSATTTIKDYTIESPVVPYILKADFRQRTIDLIIRRHVENMVQTYGSEFGSSDLDFHIEVIDHVYEVLGTYIIDMAQEDLENNEDGDIPKEVLDCLLNGKSPLDMEWDDRPYNKFYMPNVVKVLSFIWTDDPFDLDHRWVE